LSNEKKSAGESVRFDKTKAGLQGVLVTVPPSQEKLGAIRSDIPLSEQIKGTMFEVKPPDEPTLFDEAKE